MKLAHKALALAVLAALSSTASAEIAIDVIGGSEITFEGLLQADSNWYDSDVKLLNSSATDGKDSDQDRAMHVLIGIPDHESIIMFVAAGHLPSEFVVAKSVRKPISEVLEKGCIQGGFQ